MTTMTLTLLNSVFIALACYILVMFILSFIFIKNLGWKEPLQKTPLHVTKDMINIGKKYKNKKEVIKAVIKYHNKKFYSALMQVFFRFLFLFNNSIEDYWKEKRMFLHCHQHNYVFRHLIIATKRFEEHDIKLRHSLCYGNMHQYLKINISDSKDKKEWIIVDVFAISLGFKLGEKLPFFAQQVIKKRGLKKK